MKLAVVRWPGQPAPGMGQICMKRIPLPSGRSWTGRRRTLI